MNSFHTHHGRQAPANFKGMFTHIAEKKTGTESLKLHANVKI